MFEREYSFIVTKFKLRRSSNRLARCKMRCICCCNPLLVSYHALVQKRSKNRHGESQNRAVPLDSKFLGHTRGTTDDLQDNIPLFCRAIHVAETQNILFMAAAAASR